MPIVNKYAYYTWIYIYIYTHNCHDVTQRNVALSYTAWFYITLHYITLQKHCNNITFHCITLQYVTFNTLHYTTYHERLDITSHELCPKGPVLLKAIRICLRVRLRLAYATTVLAYAKDFVEFALTRSSHSIALHYIMKINTCITLHNIRCHIYIYENHMTWH